MDKPLISVIVPIYNVEKYLRRCIDSLVGQTYPNLEIVLVNDGSPDNCGEICDKYAQKNKNIKVLHQKNQGVSAARNNGVKISQGEYISFVDPDDFIPINSISRLYEALEKYHAPLVAGKRLEIYEGQEIHNGKLCEKELKTICYDTEEALRKVCYGTGISVVSWGKLYRRNLIVENPYTEGIYYEDVALTYRIIAQCEKVVELQEVVYYYLQREDSIVHCSIQPKHIEDGMRAVKEELKFMEEKHPAVVQAATYRCCFKVVEYIPRILKKNDQNLKYFKWLQKELKPFMFATLKDRNVSISFKIRCITICAGYTPTRFLWKLVAKVKGRTLA